MPKRASTSSATATAPDNEMDVDEGANSDEDDTTTGATGQGDGGGEWKKGDKVLCTQGTTEFYYDAKIVDVVTAKDGKSRYFIHYQGWHKRHDETLDDEAAKTRLKVWTEEDAAKAKEAVREAQQLSAGKKMKVVKKSLDAVKNQESSRGSTPSGVSAPTTSAKRPRHSTTAQKTPAQLRAGSSKEVRKIALPESLRKILVDDNHFINNNGYLPKVPAKVTVEQIVGQYIKSLGQNKDDFKFLYSTEPNEVITPTAETCEQSALGLLDYFNTTIGSMLLYKFERPLYAELLTKADAAAKEEGGGWAEYAGGVKTGSKLAGKARLSNQFGLVHFLRLFVRLGEMLTYTQWSARALDTIMRHAQDFVAFLDAKKDDFYNVDDYYHVAPPDYQKQAYVGGGAQ